MGEMLLNGRLYGASGIRELTQAQYDALPASKLTDGILYCIKDTGIVEGDKYAPVIYSLEEREIGVWTDGKPLYQKTIVSDTSIPNNYQWVRIYDNSTVCIKSFEGYLYSTSDREDGHKIFMDWYKKDTYKNSVLEVGNNYIEVITDYVNYGYRFTIQYTKTTDIPGSGTWGTDGVPMIHYDGNEKVIGTWFGETLYEKTIILTNIAFGLYQYIQLSDISTTLKDVTYIQGAIRRSNYNYDILDNTTGSPPCVRSNGIEYKVDSVFSTNFQQLEFIIRYTKTS